MAYFLKCRGGCKACPNIGNYAGIKALEKTGYVKSRAAKLLGLTLRQLDCGCYDNPCGVAGIKLWHLPRIRVPPLPSPLAGQFFN